MGIIEQKIGHVKLTNNRQVQIEHNVGGSVHLHIDNVRLNFSKEEFSKLATVLDEAVQDLVENKDGI
jgi:Cu2+-containing amine oxidase